MDIRICMAESLHCSSETVTALLIGYTPIQNAFGVKKKKKKNREKAWYFYILSLGIAHCHFHLLVKADTKLCEDSTRQNRDANTLWKKYQGQTARKA